MATVEPEDSDPLADTAAMPSGSRSTAAEREIDRRIGPYRLLHVIGEGGMGEVWLAEQLEPVHRPVALKIIKAGMDTKEVVARFESERQALALMNHPAIAKVFDGGTTTEGRPYFVMEYVPGVPITEHCDTHKLSTAERLELFTEVCEGVQHAHQKAVIHRDLKPSNILVSLVDGKAQPKIIDFGIAKATGYRLTERTLFTELGAVIGTPEYMSPEQADSTGQDVDTRTDVYSLGVVLYQLLTGELPFASKDLRSCSYEELRRELREVDPPSPSSRVATLDTDTAVETARKRETDPASLRRQLGGDLDAIVMKALEKERRRRYAAASELAGDLERHLRHEPIQAHLPSRIYRLRKFARRHAFLLVAAAAIASALALGVVAVGLALARARVNLASALVERARRAEDVSDWARAAAYYAASRVEHDTAAARWGLALARERIPERGSAFTGAPGAFTDVDVLSDGTLVALEIQGNQARLYEPVSGRTLWTVKREQPIPTAWIASGAVSIRAASVVRLMDERTGQELFAVDWNREKLCRNGPATRRVRIERPGVLRLEGMETPRVEVAQRDPCALSPKADRLAFRDVQGVVRLWDLDAGRELTSRAAPDAQDIVFTAHGVALVRSGSLQLFGGPEGDFSVEVPGRSASGFANVAAGRGVAVSPDGHRVVVDSPTLNRADVVDLRDRAVFVSVSRPPGSPSFAFSPDGSTLYAAGLSGGRTLISWTLRRPTALASGSAQARLYLRAARNRFILFQLYGSVALHSEDGALLRTLDVPEAAEATISHDGSTIAIAYPHEVSVQRADDGRELARIPCERCLVLLLSEDGSRLVAFSYQRRQVWDVSGPSLVRDEPLGSAHLSPPETLSRRGEWVAWVETDGVGVEELSTGARRRLPLPETPLAPSISPDGTRLVVVLPASFTLWKLPELEPVWAVPNPSSVPAVAGWSSDGSTITIAYEGAGAMLINARTGEALARMVEGRLGAGASQVNILPSLKYRLARAGNSWALTSVPSPDPTSPSESLRRTLDRGGFRLKGVELEVVSP